MSSLEQFGEAFFPPKQSKVATAYGTVQSVNADGSYQVKLNALGTTRCARLCNAAAGDAVFIVMQENGKCAAVGKVGGESSSGGNTYALQGSGVTVSLIENGTTPAGNATIQDASTSQKGVTKLSSATDSTSEALSATPKAVKDALAAAKSYTDAQIVAAGAVTGVKGAAQENYQTGNVSLSASDVGAAPVIHTHAASSITTTDGNVQSDLDTIYQDIGDLDTALAGKANSTHYHSASSITSGTLGVARGGTGASTLGKGIVYHSSSGTGALSIATAANIVSEIGNTPVNRATADANGDAIAATYSKTTHTHGSISSDGAISSDTAVATGDKLIISDASDSSKLKRSTIALDATDTEKYLRHDGTWQTVAAGTDTKVTQNVTTDDADYPLLLAPSGQTTTQTTTANFGTKLKANPSSGDLQADTFNGMFVTTAGGGLAIGNAEGNGCQLSIGDNEDYTLGGACEGLASQLLPSGGTQGQVLAKTSATDYATGWTDLPAPSVWFGVCNTGNSTAAKEVTIAGFPTTLAEGLTVIVVFSAGNTASTPLTLNVSGTGAAQIVRGRNAQTWLPWGFSTPCTVAAFTYYGTKWIVHSGYSA